MCGRKEELKIIRGYLYITAEIRLDLSLGNRSDPLLFIPFVRIYRTDILPLSLSLIWFVSLPLYISHHVPSLYMQMPTNIWYVCGYVLMSL